MVQFKCKMCGGTISVEEGKSTCECEFCGTTQTVPSAIDNNKIAVLHNRANSLRLKNEFDKALANYENIIIENPNDAEAHWGALLCRYGIEYVDDPKTGRKIPTCHRTQTKSIFDDIDYKAAMDNSDVVAKQLYQDEAEQINKIQKSILAVSVNEKPYDIFICYKESDEYGKRTKDSVISQEIYDELTKKGYKVFFAKITLESKLGSQYEPYIFAALNSARVMLVIGTKAEYFNAVWVKNEWARFLSIMSESNGKKYIIPCYRDIDAYELPDELLSFQAQDMGKLGFIQDLTRGIDKLFNRSEVKKEEKTDASQYTSSVNVSALLRRAEILLQSNNKEKANELLEEVLNNDPENAKAYALLAVIDLGFTKESDLEKSKSPLTNNANYNFAVQFADSNYKIVLRGYNDKILERMQVQQNESIYQDAINCKSNHKYDEAIRKFESIINYKDSKNMIDACKKYIEQAKENKYQQGLDFISKYMYDRALSILNEIKGYKDSIELISKVNDLSQYELKYKKALNYAKNNTIYSYNEAIHILSDITSYRDSSSLIQKYKEKIEELKARNERSKFLFKRFSIISAICIFFIIVGIVLTINIFIPTHKYNKAMKYIESGNYASANALLLELNGYSDSINQIEIVNAHQAFDEDDYEKGIDYIYNIGGTVNISYDGNGGEAEVGNETIKKLSYVTNKASRDGYTFYGWTVGEYKIYKSKGEYYCDLSLKSSWDLITYSLSYDLAGGNVTEELPKTYDITNPITLPNPTRKGYTFLGWKEARADNAIVDYVMADGTFGNKEYTAFWIANKYQLTFDLAGGQMSVNSLEVTYDSECSLPIPERIGYQFAGWYAEDNKILGGIWNIDSDLILKANWNISTYTISYNLDGGVNHEKNKANYTIEEDLIIYAPHKIGYTFIGWSISSSGVLQDSISISKGTIGDISLYANWQANKYTLTFDVNGGNNLDCSSIEIEYDSNYELEDPTRPGYKFIGWYNNDNLFIDGVWNYLESINIVAHWDIINYSITYDLNGGNATNPVSYNYDMNDLIIADPTKTGYTFLGWTNDTIEEPQKGFTISQHSTGEVNLFANWQVNKYKLIYDVNGGNSLSQDTIEIEYESDFELLTPSRPGYSFDGWYSGDNKFESGKWSYIIDINVKARWTIVIYTINYDLDGGTASNNTSYNYETDSFALNSPEKEGHTFLGWTSDEIFVPTKEIEIRKNSVGNLSFVANWQVNCYSVEINNSAIGISIYVDESYTYNEEITIDSTGDIEDGYTLRWIINGSEVKYGRKMSMIIPARDVTIEVDSIWIYSREEDVLYFGYYPQARIDDLTITNNLNTLAGSLPTQDNLYNWSDYGYRNKSNQRYMYYIDVEYDNNMYRGVYYTEYRKTSSIQSNYQEYNGYPINNVYWFLWEKVKWDIAKNSDGKLMLVTDIVIDSMNFDDGSQGRNCYYNRTTIKKWLNGTFLNSTFNNPSQSLLEDMYIESEVNKLYILDTTEYYSVQSNISSCGLSDYALCQGYFTGSEIYWLRTVHNINGYNMGMQVAKRLTGEISYIDAMSSSKFNELVKTDDVGVRPACWVDLDYYTNGGVS